MNNAKMWLVVKPTVGVPLVLSAVAVGSFAVHVAVLTNTSWVSDFLSGQKLGSGDQAAALQLQDGEGATANASLDAPRLDGTDTITLYLSDGTPVTAVIQPPEVHAAVDSGILPNQ